MGRHAVVEVDPPTVRIAVTPPAPAAPGATVAAWARTKAWSARRSVGAVVVAHLGLTALSCVLVFPAWLLWSVAVGAATLAVTRCRELGPRLLIGLAVATASCYLVRFVVISALLDALGYDRTESVEAAAWLAHPGSAALGVALAAAVDADVRATLHRLWAIRRPALTATPLRTAITVGVTLLMVVAALLPVARGLSSSRGFSWVVPASQQTDDTGSTARTSALGCSVDDGTGTADATCTRDALIARVCDLDVSRADASGSTGGMTVWVDGNGNMVRFSTNFTPTVPFTEGGIECVGHTERNGYPEAVAHDLRLHAADWAALTGPGALPAELESRIDQA